MSGLQDFWSWSSHLKVSKNSHFIASFKHTGNNTGRLFMLFSPSFLDLFIFISGWWILVSSILELPQPPCHFHWRTLHIKNKNCIAFKNCLLWVLENIDQQLSGSNWLACQLGGKSGVPTIMYIHMSPLCCLYSPLLFWLKIRIFRLLSYAYWITIDTRIGKYQWGSWICLTFAMFPTPTWNWNTIIPQYPRGMFPGSPMDTKIHGCSGPLDKMA